MKYEKNRIFIKNLPETASQSEIELAFSKYGTVLSVDIKERKDITTSQSQFFAYINIETDKHNLQKCFQKFSQNEWHGAYVELQIAKENFLERLKREREETQTNKTEVVLNAQQNDANTTININELKTAKVKKIISSPSDSDTPRKRVRKSSGLKTEVNETSGKDLFSESNHIIDDEEIDIVIKNNKHKKIDLNGLKIESVGREPIIKLECKKTVKKITENDQKRINGLKNIINDHHQKQALIKAALSKVDSSNQNKKIIFNNKVDKSIAKNNNDKTNALFGNNDDDSDDNFNFNMKVQFDGKQGEKLLKLQSTYKNDKRFMLDQRFADELENDGKSNEKEISLEEEKREQFQILENVLGNKVKTRNSNDDPVQRKKMLRFDPDLPDHRKYEMSNAEVVQIKKKKKKDLEKHEQKPDDELPNVSKEIFYNVEDNLKDALENDHQFSLLGTFGQVQHEHDSKRDEECEVRLEKRNLTGGKNPFKYDSTDDEEDEQKQNKNDIVQEKNANKSQKFWHEPFFFKDDDYRLQDGFDFIKRIESAENGEFVQIRRDIKQIVKAKVRNNLRNNRPFKRKLGGNKKKKMIRIKKALMR